VASTCYDCGGNAGDLQTAGVHGPSGTALDTICCRYSLPGAANGYAHGLRYAFGPVAYALLAAAYAKPGTASDAQAPHFLFSAGARCRRGG
jgi:hypothetical protein